MRLLMFLLFLIFINCKATPPTYTLLKEGKVKNVEYIKGSFSTYSCTIITFTDGTKIVFKSYQDVLHPYIYVYNKIFPNGFSVGVKVILYKKRNK